jgi:hypothetical protein
MIRQRLSTQSDRVNEVLSHVPSCGSLFDPTEPGHKTGPEWAAAGPHGWFMNLIVYTLAHGEARHNVCIGSLAMMPVAEPVYGWLRRSGPARPA